MVDSRYTAYTPDANGYICYSKEEHQVWTTLYDRQIKIIENRAVDDHFTGLNLLGLTREHIPQPVEVSSQLKEITGWSVTPVPALIDFDTFFDLLSRRIFPAASFIRRMEDLDYLQEPDIFHEIFGHCPMLAQHSFADFTKEVGDFGKTLNHKDQVMLARLYWFTVEFGLIHTPSGIRIYGAGILSSKAESIYALESDKPLRREFNLIEILRTPYRYDEMQKIYFIIDSYEKLFNMVNNNLSEAFAEARSLGMLPSLYGRVKEYQEHH